jgi:hypothetical protein
MTKQAVEQVRLRPETRARVAQELAEYQEKARLTLSASQVVDMLVNEALDARQATSAMTRRGKR